MKVHTLHTSMARPNARHNSRNVLHKTAHRSTLLWCCVTVASVQQYRCNVLHPSLSDEHGQHFTRTTIVQCVLFVYANKSDSCRSQQLAEVALWSSDSRASVETAVEESEDGRPSNRTSRRQTQRPDAEDRSYWRHDHRRRERCSPAG
jgi:hypothetical protein